MQKKKFDVEVDIIIDDNLYSDKPKLKGNKPFKEAVNKMIDENIHSNEYFSKFKIKPLKFKIIPQTKMPIHINHRGGFMTKVDDDCVKTAIERKEKKLPKYIERNREKPFDEYWLFFESS